MAQLDARKLKFSDSSNTQTTASFKTPRAQISPPATSSKAPTSTTSPPATSFKTPKSTTSPTFQQLLQGDATIWPPSPFGKHRDFEGSQSPSIKLTVIARAKEKARKWRHSLSIKRRQKQNNEQNNGSLFCQFTPSLDIRLNDHKDEEEEEDPEYLGAPMYESALAPENYKETAKQHSRAVPVPSEKHVLESSAKNDVKKQEGGANSSKNMTELVSEKPTPGSDPTPTIASRIAGLTIDTSESTDSKGGSTTNINPRAAEAAKDGTSGTEKADSSMEGRVHGQSNSPGKWERGISVKEYLLKKLEPGEDEKALSQVITEKISPRRYPSEQVGMVERMKEAVTSFLRTEEPCSDSETKTNTPQENDPNSSANANSSSEVSTSSNKTSSPRKLVYTTQNPSSPNFKTNTSSHNTRSMTKAKSMSHANSTSAFKNTNSSSHVPVSKSTHVPEEENNGRILQAN